MSQSGVYSELKPAWWYALEGVLPAAPKQVELILSDLCNQDCHFCAYRMSGYTSNELFLGDSQPARYGHDNPKRMIDTERALSMIDEFNRAGVLAVQFTGGGEPTVHKDHEKIFEKTLSVGMKAALVSNGLRWSKKLKEEILPKFSWVRVSIDAGNAESYGHIRRTPRFNWQHVWDNVRDLSDSLDRVESDAVFGLGFVVTPWSWKEMPEFTELAAQSGADNVRFTAMFSTEDEKPYLGIYDDIVAVIRDVREKYGSDSFAIHDNFGSRFSDLKQHSPDYSFCSHQYYTSYVGGDLNVYRCCVLAYNRRGMIDGNSLKEKSFDVFWNSDERKDDMEAFDASECERCQFNEKNRAVNYLMSDNPPHKEFT
jgi:MoaA/NifB/PqqE/SkfB family radical SAM enzyme